MQKLKLNNKLNLGIECREKKVRLIVLDKVEELACRKETFNNLQRFIESEEAYAFKGRLQLFKKSDIINVEVKGENLGSVSTKNFKNVLQRLAKYKIPT